MSATAFQRIRREAASKKEIENSPGEEKQLSEMDIEELRAYAEKNNIDIGKSTSTSGILEKIQAAEKSE